MSPNSGEATLQYFTEGVSNMYSTIVLIQSTTSVESTLWSYRQHFLEGYITGGLRKGGGGARGRVGVGDPKVDWSQRKSFLSFLYKTFEKSSGNTAVEH